MTHHVVAVEPGLTSLQEGDIIRLLRRVLDLLRQIPRLPYVPGARGVDAQLRLNARRALTIMDRFPVSDDVTYSIDDDEGLADDDTMALAGEMAAKRGISCRICIISLFAHCISL